MQEEQAEVEGAGPAVPRAQGRPAQRRVADVQDEQERELRPVDRRAQAHVLQDGDDAQDGEAAGADRRDLDVLILRALAARRSASRSTSSVKPASVSSGGAGAAKIGSFWAERHFRRRRRSGICKVCQSGRTARRLRTLSRFRAADVL